MDTDARAHECILHWGTPMSIAIPTVWRMCQCAVAGTAVQSPRTDKTDELRKIHYHSPVIFRFLKRCLPPLSPRARLV